MTETGVVDQREAAYRGLRMTADEYLALPDDGFRYELVDGVVCRSPSPSFEHQSVSTEVAAQIAAYLAGNPIGRVIVEVDVKLREDLVYRPDVVFLRTEKVSRAKGRIRDVPDLVVEVISPGSRRYDSETKRKDYQSAGVAKYWLIDPQRRTLQFFVLESGALREAEPRGAQYAATVLPGFELDIERIQCLF